MMESTKQSASHSYSPISNQPTEINVSDTNNGGVCIDKRKDSTYICQMKALIAKLTRLKY